MLIDFIDLWGPFYDSISLLKQDFTTKALALTFDLEGYNIKI